MNDTAILLPSLVMALITLGLIGAMGIRRTRAVAAGTADPKYYKLYTGGDEPDNLRAHTRHVQNHFEVPPLFHVVCLITFVTGAVDGWMIGLAWAYVAMRVVHSFIHLGSNWVPHRFYAFGASLFALTAMVIILLVRLIGATSGG